MEPEEYEIWAEGQADGYDFDQEESELFRAVMVGDLERVRELLPTSTMDERLDAFNNLILHTQGNGLSEEEIVTLTMLLLEPGTTTSYLGLIEAIERYPASFLLPVVKYAKDFIPPKDRLRFFLHTTVPVVKELLDRVDVVKDRHFFWLHSNYNQDVLTYLRDMGKIPEALWEQEYGPMPRLPGEGNLTRLIEYYL